MRTMVKVLIDPRVINNIVYLDVQRHLIVVER